MSFHPIPHGNVSPRSIAIMLLLAVLWGVSIPLTKLGLQFLPPLTLTALRFAIAVPVFLLLIRGKPRLPRRALGQTIALGVVGIGIGQVAQTFGVGGTSASAGTILSATIPLFVVIFAAVHLKQTVTMSQWLGLLVAFAGMVMVATGQHEGAGKASTWAGIAWMLLSSLTIAFYYVWSLELTQKHGVEPVSAWGTFFGFIALLPWTIQEIAHEPVSVTGAAVAIAAYLGIVVTVIGLFLWLYILRNVPAGIAAGVQYLQPVVGIALAAIMFGDSLTITFIIGVAFIFAGLALAVARPRLAQPLANE